MDFSTNETQIVPLPTSGDVLTEVIRQGAKQLLSHAIEAEVAEWIEGHQERRDAQGRQQVVRNGFLPPRTILTGIGPVDVKQPRVHDRRPKEEA
jgi:putative transposase